MVEQEINTHPQLGSPWPHTLPAVVYSCLGALLRAPWALASTAQHETDGHCLCHTREPLSERPVQRVSSKRFAISEGLDCVNMLHSPALQSRAGTHPSTEDRRVRWNQGNGSVPELNSYQSRGDSCRTPDRVGGWQGNGRRCCRRSLSFPACWCEAGTRPAQQVLRLGMASSQVHRNRSRG